MKEIKPGKIKNLICGLAAMPNPFFLIPEFLVSEWPYLKKFLDSKNGIGKPNPKLFESDAYDGIELVLWGMFDENWNIREERLKKYKEGKLPLYTFHACFESFPSKLRNVYLNLAENDKAIKKAIRSHVEAASILGKENPILVFHPGVIKNDGEKTQALRNVINNLGEMAYFAQQKGVTLTLENMPQMRNLPPFCNNFTELKYILEKIKHPNLKITFDWGHLNTCLTNCEYKNYSKKLEKNFYFSHINQFIDAAGEDIIHAHIHYNRSHLNRFSKLRRGLLKKFLIYLFFWTSMSKFIRNDRENDLYDEHLTLNKIQDEYLGSYGQTIKNLLEKSSIKKYGFVTHEISPRRVFQFFTYSKTGAKFADYIDGLKIFKKMIIS
jgi:sugar phosphate isomerase/epimerase